MTIFSLILIALAAAILTFWLLVIPVDIIIGTFSTLLHRERERHHGHGWKEHHV